MEAVGVPWKTEVREEDSLSPRGHLPRGEDSPEFTFSWGTEHAQTKQP